MREHRDKIPYSAPQEKRLRESVVLSFFTRKTSEGFEQGGSIRSVRKKTVRGTVFADGATKPQGEAIARQRVTKPLALRHSIRVFKRLKALVFLSENIRFLPSRRRFADGRAYLFMGVWRQVAARQGGKRPVCLCLWVIIKLQDIV